MMEDKIVDKDNVSMKSMSKQCDIVRDWMSPGF